MAKKGADTLTLISECEKTLELLGKKSEPEIKNEINVLRAQLKTLQGNKKKLRQELVRVLRSLPKDGEFRNIKSKVKEHIKSKDISSEKVKEMLNELKKDLSTEQDKGDHANAVGLLRKYIGTVLDNLSKSMEDVRFLKLSGSEYECTFDGKSFKFEEDKGKEKQQFYLEIYKPYKSVKKNIEELGKQITADKGDKLEGSVVLKLCDSITDSLSDASKKAKKYKPPMILNDRKQKKAVAVYLGEKYLDCENTIRDLGHGKVRNIM